MLLFLILYLLYKFSSLRKWHYFEKNIRSSSTKGLIRARVATLIHQASKSQTKWISFFFLREEASHPKRFHTLDFEINYRLTALV